MTMKGMSATAQPALSGIVPNRGLYTPIPIARKWYIIPIICVILNLAVPL